MNPNYLDGSPVATVILRGGIVTYLNPAAATLAGVSREALLGRPYTQFLAPEDLEKVVERQGARLRGERVPAVYEVAVRVEGRRRTARVHAAVVDGDIVLQLLDVTDEASHGLRLNALAQFGALVQQERSDEAIFRATRRGMESLGLHCTMVRVDGEQVEVLFVDTDPGRRERWEKALGRSMAGVIRTFTPLLRRAWMDGSAFTDDYVSEAARFLGFPGSGLFPEGPDLRGVAVRIDVGGRPWALLVAVGDWLRTDDQAALRLFGAQVSAALDAARSIQVLSDRNAELAALYRLAVAAGESQDLETFLAVGGRTVEEILGCRALAIYLLAADGQAVELAHASQGLPELHAELPRTTLDSPLLGLAIREARSVVRLASEAREPAASVLARAGIVTIAAVPLRFRSSAIGVLVAYWPDRRDPAACRLPLLEAMGAPFSAAVYTHRLVADLRARVDELAQTQAQLVRQERLAALGELAAVVAHEVRNPLGAIFNSLGALRRMVRPAGDARMLFDIVGEEADRLNRIVGDLLDFARPSKPSIRAEPVAPLLEEALAAALPHAAVSLEVVRDVDPDLPPVPADAHQLRQALLNLVQNAVQAMPGGGRLTARARRDGEGVRLEIADTGPGVPAALREKVFEPFYTTRATGTGLGLAVVRRVAQDHRGTVALEDAPGGGTAVVLRLPLAAPAPVAVRPDLG